MSFVDRLREDRPLVAARSSHRNGWTTPDVQNLMCILGGVLISLWLLQTTNALAAEPAVYRWQRAIELPALTSTTAVSVPFDSQVFSATRDGFPDLRLRRTDGVPVSFVVRQAPATEEKTVRRSWLAKQTGVKLLENGGMQVLLEVGDKEPLPTGLQIATPLRDFELQVRVEWSADGETWTAAGAPAVIFDYSQHIDARHLDVPVASEQRRLRLTVEDVTTEQESQLLELSRRLRGGDETDRTERITIQRRPFRIDRIEFFRDDATVQTKESHTTQYPAADFAVSQDAEKHQTLITFATQREPITAIRLLTDEANFSRTATVEVEQQQPSGAAGWRAVGSGTLTRFAVGTLSKDERKLTIAETRGERYRVVIENRDSPPLAITGVELSGPVYEAVFLASAGEGLQLDYGSPDAAAGHFDTAALQASLSTGTKPLAATLGPPREDTSAPTQPKWTPWNDPTVLIGGIVVLTVVLGWGLYAAGRRVEPMSESQPPSE
jgi:hypothetical protein